MTFISVEANILTEVNRYYWYILWLYWKRLWSYSL